MKKIFYVITILTLILIFNNFSFIEAKNITENDLTLSTFSTQSELEAYARALGFNISDDYRFSDNAKCQPNYTVSHMEKDKLQYEVYIYDFLLQNKNNLSLYAYIFKVHLSPQDGRNNGFLGIGSYGGRYVNGYVKVTVARSEATNFLDYVPKNSPSTISGSIGVGLNESGFDISANFDYSVSDLEIISSTNYATRTYETTYDFVDLGNNYSLYSNYVKGDVDLYGMLLLQFDYSMTLIPQYEINFNEVSGFENDVTINRGNILHFD